MTPWVVAVVAGAAFAIVQYGWRRGAGTAGPFAFVAALLRWLVATLVVALVLDAPAGRAVAAAPWVAIDVSASMARGDAALWRTAVDSARSVAPESTFAFGDSLRADDRLSRAPSDVASDLRAAVDRAAASGHPLVVVTDGEVADAMVVGAAPAGSRAVVIARAVLVDVAVLDADLPRAAVSGDTIVARFRLGAGGVATPEGALVVLIDGVEAARVPVSGLPPYGTRSIEVRLALAGPPGTAVVSAAVRVAGDAVSANDSLAVAVDRSRSASAVFVSTNPDFDSRATLGLMRGALSIPARGFVRVAPGAWRVDGALSPVSEADVRAALRDAPVAVLHGDTAVFGPPVSATAAPYALIVPMTDSSAEWYVSGTPASPLSAALSGVGWDSMPPVLAGGPEPTGTWTAMEVRAARDGRARALVVGREAPRRSVTIVGSGFWRWRFRGGRSSDAFAAFWGGVIDWLAGERTDRRAATPAAASFRAGEAIRWRRGGPGDSIVHVSMRRRNAPTGKDSMTLRFAPGASIVTSPPLPPGVYDVGVVGGTAAVVVNASAEWLPRAPTIRSGPIGGGTATGTAPRLRDIAWVYVIAILGLCVEWLVRRRMGVR